MFLNVNNIIRKSTYIVFFLLISGNVCGFTLKVTGAEVGLLFRPEFNLSSNYSWDIAAIGSLELNDQFVFKGGFTAGRIWDITAVNAQGSAEYNFPFFKHVPLSLRAVYIYNGMPDYEMNIHSIIPFATFGLLYFGVEIKASVGYLMRFTAFRESPAVFEGILQYSIDVNFYNSEYGNIGIGFSNFDDFSARDLASYSFGLKSRLRLLSRIFIINELRIDLGENVARLSSIYAMVYKGGVVFSW